MTDSSGPLTEYGLGRLRALAEGNGIEADKISIVGSEELELNVQAEMLLTLDVRRETKQYMGGFQGMGKRGTDSPVHALQSADQVEPAVREIMGKVGEDDEWIKSAVTQIKAEPGEGWGLEDADVTLEEMAHVFYVTQVCSTCGGLGNSACTTCHGTGLIPCQHCNSLGRELCYECHGSGYYQGSTTTYCTVCKGATLAPCRKCQGRQQVGCPQCSGKGKMQCQTCNGQGKSTVEEKAIPTVHCAFTIVASGELPSGFRRAISRGGLAVLTKGHATITSRPVSNENPEKIFIPYLATLPYSEMRVRLPGHVIRIAVMGHKKAMLDVPAFLDRVVEPKISEVEGSDAVSGFKKAFELRVVRDAFGLMQSGKYDIRDLRRLYPQGLSVAMLERVQKLLVRLMQQGTARMRLLAGGIYVVVASLCQWLFLASGVRQMVEGMAGLYAVVGLDLVISLLNLMMGIMTLQWASAVQLRKLIGAEAVGSAAAQRRNGLDVALSTIPVLAYFALIALLPSLPNWFASILAK
jgi:hypothetical protein